MHAVIFCDIISNSLLVKRQKYVTLVKKKSHMKYMQIANMSIKTYNFHV